MEVLRKAQKIHKCDNCHGNIQKGEIYNQIATIYPTYNDEYSNEQTGITYINRREHNRYCWSRLLYADYQKEMIKNCNFGKHSPVQNNDPEEYDNRIWCEWCGKEL